MRAELKSFFSPDCGPDPEKPGYILDVARWKPADPSDFGILIEATIGVEGEAGEESWLKAWLEKEIEDHGKRGWNPKYTWGSHNIVVSRWNYEDVRRILLDLCKRSEGPDWSAISRKLSRYGKWEFQDTELDR